MGTNPGQVQFQNPKTNSLGSRLLRKGQGRMSAVWVAWFSAHFAGLSQVPLMADNGEFQSPTFSSSSSSFLFTSDLTACRLPTCSAENMHVSQLNCHRQVTEAVEASHKQSRADHGVQARGGATCIWTSIDLEGCLA